MNFASICRSLSGVRPTRGLAAEHVHDFRIAIRANEQPHRAFRRDLVRCRCASRIQPLDALLDVAEQRGAVRRFRLEAMDERIALRERLARTLDGARAIPRASS